ncbi:class I SAM-dependent methyltransferase [Bacillus carboniphilus]|uniref:Class I SAM-dependent methyltransferase n=1 Tax=Bacillus carboniphilus TaxID=86663 RepID=A0ABY9JWR5_9BACI|nr:class I SAM-dependent methyltransferase [Bacillus carboniphilus]WLR42738.1 class I SAM-dependent methyltransferase [Bacillus carboniphilus]
MDVKEYVRLSNLDFSGWDFSCLLNSGRMQEEMLSWSYGSSVLPYMQRSNSMLDMGTGGGELLSTLQPFPKKIAATEQYKPNVQIAKQRLEPLGVKVKEIQGDHNLPFASSSFDLVINRHESYNVNEVKRILTNNGTFITQQVGGADCADLNKLFGVPVNGEYLNWNLSNAVKDLKNAGLSVTFCKEEFPEQRFYDVGAILYYLKAIPWQIINFDPIDYMDELNMIDQRIQSTGYIEVRQHRFIISANK